MIYNAFIFDMDGTLVDNMPTHYQAWKETLAEAGVQIDPVNFARQTTGMTNREILRSVLPTISEDEISYWGERKEELYRERFLCCRDPLPGLMEFLDSAQALNIPMAVATAAGEENVRFILDATGLRPYFQTVVNAQDIQHGKPDPEIFLKTAARLGQHPKNCLVFEDALGGIEAARRAGMRTIFLMTSHPAQAVSAYENLVCAVPDYTLLSPESLVK